MELELEAWMRVERWILKDQAALFTVRTMTNIYQRLVSLRASVGYHKQKVGRLRHVHTFLLLATGIIHGNRIATSPFIRLSTIFPSFLPSPFPPSPSLILPLFLASYTANHGPAIQQSIRTQRAHAHEPPALMPQQECRGLDR